MRTYRRSALASALVRMWRGWTVIVPVVVVNALVQALLVWPESTLDRDWLLLVSAAVSAVAFMAAYGLVAATALGVSDGRVTWRGATDALRAHALRYGLWALGLFLAFVAALALNDAVALLLLGLTPFVLLAAVDGQRNPLTRNVRTIGRRFWRWLVTMLLMGTAVVLGTVVSGFTAFFLRGALAALVVWLVAGLVLSWFTTAWALIYRSAWVEPGDGLEAHEAAVGATPDLEPPG